MIKFLHRRNYQKLETLSGVRLELDARGGATVAFEKSYSGKVIAVAVARCPYSQNFNKKIGRNVSSGRLEKAKGVQYFDYDGSIGPTKFVQDLILTGKIAIR